jgi:UDP-N-acetylmuramoylalanine--D-glutamate ligase
MSPIAMRPTLSWSDLPGRTVGLYGLGAEGAANLRACRARGIEPLLVDDARLEDVGGQPVAVTAEGGLDALLSCDVVIKSPGISRYSPAVLALESAGVPVAGGLGLWLQEADRSKVACITGTKGKSTTTAIAGHLLAALGYRCLVGGNIGVPPFDPDVGDDFDYWVIEVSSYQVLDLAVAPPVVGVTSLHPDHLPWHRGESEQYFRDKLSLCTLPGADLTIANGDSPLLLERRDLLGPRVQWVQATDDPTAAWLAPLQLFGTHNRRNALIARALLQALGVPEADDDTRMTNAANGFAGLESRLKVIGEIGGVTFVDDSLSTNVLPTLAAVEAFPDRRVALIVGGFERGIDYRPLAEGLRSRTTELLLVTVPDNGAHIAAVVDQTGAGPAVTVLESDELTAAVRSGLQWAEPDGVVLLSPAAASFGRYRDYRERAAAFADAMRACERPES